MQPKQYLENKHIPMLAVPDYDKVLGHDWEQVDFGALGEFDVNVLMELYADADTSGELTPDWRGGYYYAAHRKGTPRENVAFIYVSKWSDEDAAESFAKLFAASWKQRYSHLRTEARKEGEDPSLVRRSTEQGQVSVERHGELVIAMESFPDEEAGRLRKSALEVDRGGSKDSAMLLRVPARPAFDPGKFASFPGMLLTARPAVFH
jgi:hypothetical protein